MFGELHLFTQVTIEVMSYKYGDFDLEFLSRCVLKNPGRLPGYIPGAGIAKLASRPVYIPGAGLKEMYVTGLKEKQAQLQRYYGYFNEKTATESGPTYAAGGSNWNPGNWAANIGLWTQRANTKKINTNIKKYNDRQIQNNQTGIKPDGTFVNFNYGGEGILTDHNGYAKSLKPIFDPSLNNEQRKHVTNNLRGMHIMGGWTDVDGRHKKFTGELPLVRSTALIDNAGSYSPWQNTVLIDNDPTLTNTIDDNRNVLPHELTHWQQRQNRKKEHGIFANGAQRRHRKRYREDSAYHTKVELNADHNALNLQPYVNPESRMTSAGKQWAENAVREGKDKNQYVVPHVPLTDPTYFKPYRRPN